jgi:hypothetical protein
VLGRIAFFLLLGTIAFGAAALAFDWRINLSPGVAEAIGWRESLSDEELVDADTRLYVNDAKIRQRVEDAVARDDSADAMLWIEMARRYGIPLAGGLEAAAYAIKVRDDSIETQFSDYMSGFLRGSADSIAGLAGAVTSDLTVYGDVRDIVLEGGKMVAGEEYSEFILSLSVVGLAATVGTVATGGGGIVVKAGLSLVKFARRAGHMTAAFAARLTRLAGDAIDMPAFRRTMQRLDLTDPMGSWKVLTDYAATVKGARIFDVLGKLEDIRATVGTTEALRLLKRMERIEDVDDIHGLSKAAGKRTRGVIELTGKTSMRAIKYTANVLHILLEHVFALILWIGTLLAAILIRVLISAWHLMRWLIRRVRGSLAARQSLRLIPR